MTGNTHSCARPGTATGPIHTARSPGIQRLWPVLLVALVVPATAQTVTWNVQAKYGITAAGIRTAISDAKAVFRETPDAVVVLQFDAGTFSLEDQGPAKGTIDLSGIEPGESGRLIFRGEGMDKTTLVFGDNKHAIYGVKVHRVTMADLHMTRKEYTVSQGLVVEATPGKVVLDIQEGFPTPAMIFDAENDQGRYLRRYTNSRTDPQMIGDHNDQIPWTSARQVEGQRWEILLKKRNEEANYAKGDLIGIKSKHGGQTYWLSHGSDFVFQSVKWTQQTRGVFRDGFERIQILECVTERSPPINGQTPCLASPDGGPQIGQPYDPPIAGNLVRNCRFTASGDDAVAFFNAAGEISGCTIRDAFARGILLANSPHAVLASNTVIRCAVQNSPGFKLPKSGGEHTRDR